MLYIFLTTIVVLTLIYLVTNQNYTLSRRLLSSQGAKYIYRTFRYIIRNTDSFPKARKELLNLQSPLTNRYERFGLVLMALLCDLYNIQKLQKFLPQLSFRQKFFSAIKSKIKA